MERPAWMPGEPGTDLGLLVGCIVVEDDMHLLVGGHLGLHGVEEADEFLVSMALHVAPDHRAIEYVERGKERGGAVTLVVMGHGRAATALKRQPWLGPVDAWIWLFSSTDSTMACAGGET